MRDGLFFVYKESLDASMKAQYNKLRNEIQRDIKQAKADYLRNSFEDNMDKPKKLWQKLKHLRYSNTNKVQKFQHSTPHYRKAMLRHTRKLQLHKLILHNDSI